MWGFLYELGLIDCLGSEDLLGGETGGDCAGFSGRLATLTTVASYFGDVVGEAAFFAGEEMRGVGSLTGEDGGAAAAGRLGSKRCRVWVVGANGRISGSGTEAGCAAAGAGRAIAERRCHVRPKRGRLAIMNQ